MIVLVLTPLTAGWPPGSAGSTPAATARASTSPVPRIGGLAIVIGILVPALLFVDLDGPYPGILIGTAGGGRGRACSTTSAACDPVAKLLLVLAIALIPVLGWHIALPPEPAGGRHRSTWAGIGYPITILWIAFLANLVNLIDGMDALAAGIVAHRRRPPSRCWRCPSAAPTPRRWPRSSAAPRWRSCATTTTRPRSSWATRGALALGFLLGAIAVRAC